MTTEPRDLPGASGCRFTVAKRRRNAYYKGVAMKTPSCSGAHALHALSPTLMVCNNCGLRLGFASAKKIGALVGAKKGAK